MDFAYICFVNNNSLYVNLLFSTISSVIRFSRFKIIVYAIDCPESLFPTHPQLIVRHISHQNEIKCIFYYKPWIIRDAIQNGLQAGYYIESDDLVTDKADDYLLSQLDKCQTIPISPIHPDDVKISDAFMNNIGVSEKTQHYIHGHVLFSKNNLAFVEEWYQACLKSTGECWDESVLNCMYWKAGCKDHYLPIIDPYYSQYYDKERKPEATRVPAPDDPVIVTWHGCKNPVEKANHLLDLIRDQARKSSS